MPLFHRSPRSAPAASPQAAPASALPAGTLPCAHTGCTRSDGLACTYVDRRRRACATAWCPDHVAVADGAPYCRRHAGVVHALPGDGPQGMPDLDNRAPSLLDWVARDLDGPLRALLESRRGPGMLLTAEPTRRGFGAGGERVRRWERFWKLSDHTGLREWAALGVDEDVPEEVHVRVNAVVRLRAVPPWIEARRTGRVLSAAEDADERRRFNERLLESVREGLNAAPPT